MLEIANNKLKQIDKNCFLELKQLTNLNLKNNEIDSIDKDTFLELHQLDQFVKTGSGVS